MIHTPQLAEKLLSLLKEIDSEARLLGSLAEGKSSSHDIDVLFPSVNRTPELKETLTAALVPERVVETDWEGFYFFNTIFGDVDIFFDTSEFTYGIR